MREFETIYLLDLIYGIMDKDIGNYYYNNMFTQSMCSLLFCFCSLSFIQIICKYNYSKIVNNIYCRVYEYFFGDPEFNLSTPLLFNYSLDKIRSNTNILDFGCGNGICYDYFKVRNNIVNKNLNIQGIDIDPVYIEDCKNRIRKNKLESNVNIKLQNIFTFKIAESENKFDYILFSESAPLLTNEFIIETINYMEKNLLKPDGKIIFINNLSKSDNNMKNLKPYLKYLTMIDFGRILTKEEFIDISLKVNKNIEMNLIDKMKISKILKYFNFGFTMWIMKNILKINDYDVEQYEIILSNE